MIAKSNTDNYNTRHNTIGVLHTFPPWDGKNLRHVMEQLVRPVSLLLYSCGDQWLAAAGVGSNPDVPICTLFLSLLFYLKFYRCFASVLKGKRKYTFFDCPYLTCPDLKFFTIYFFHGKMVNLSSVVKLLTNLLDWLH